MAVASSESEVPVPSPARIRSKLADYGFFAALALAALLFYRTVKSVAVPIVIGAFAAVLAGPLCARLAARFHDRRRWAAAATTAIVLLLVVLPAGALGWALVSELSDAAVSFAARLANDGVGGLLNRLPVPARLRRAISPDQLQAVGDLAVARTGRLVPQLLSMASSLLLGAFLFVISLYYFLIDGRRWMREVERLAPIEPRYVRAFRREFENVSYALFYGSVVTAFVQGLVAGLGYLLFGVPHPILWGAATALMSLTPIVGTASVWIPVAIAMGVSGEVGSAIGVAVWGILATGSIDNVIRPLLMRGRMRLHPLVIFLSIIGGVAAFGMVGLLIGPLAAALFLTALRIYDRDYRERLLEPDEPTSEATGSFRPTPSRPAS